jgi:hypothetical protein
VVHAIPQPPQLLVVSTSVQVVPPQQSSFAAQLTPHAPQLASVLVASQLLLQQEVPPPHVWPQSPQCAGSEPMLRHMPPQHRWLAPQRVPQAPQFCSSVPRLNVSSTRPSQS